ncbi:MAG: endonuclease/exonuclease/phosphatase family protein [Patescibacteria group bacterium]
MPSQLEVVSLNAGANHGNAVERLFDMHGVVVEYPRPIDVLLIQELPLETGMATAMSITGRLSEKHGREYHMAAEPIYGERHPDKYSAVISSMPQIGRGVMDFGPDKEAVQKVELERENGEVISVANVHFEASPTQELHRRHKARAIARAFEYEHPYSPHIIAGDFNATQYFSSLKVLEKFGYDFAHKAANGEHPAHTYPTPLSGQELLDGGYSKPHQYYPLRGVARALKCAKLLSKEQISAAGIMQYAIDHIMYRHMSPATAAGLVYDPDSMPKPFSDHYGIWATLQLP